MNSIFNRNKYVLEKASLIQGFVKSFLLYDFDTGAQLLSIEEESGFLTGLMRLTMLGQLVPYKFIAKNPIDEVVFMVARDFTVNQVNRAQILDAKDEPVAQFAQALFSFSKYLEVVDIEGNLFFSIHKEMVGTYKFFDKDERLLAQLDRESKDFLNLDHLFSSTSHSRALIQIEDITPKDPFIRQIILASMIYLDAN